MWRCLWRPLKKSQIFCSISCSHYYLSFSLSLTLSFHQFLTPSPLPPPWIWWHRLWMPLTKSWICCSLSSSIHVHDFFPSLSLWAFHQVLTLPHSDVIYGWPQLSKILWRRVRMAPYKITNLLLIIFYTLLFFPSLSHWYFHLFSQPPISTLFMDDPKPLKILWHSLWMAPYKITNLLLIIFFTLLFFPLSLTLSFE